MLYKLADQPYLNFQAKHATIDKKLEGLVMNLPKDHYHSKFKIQKLCLQRLINKLSIKLPLFNIFRNEKKQLI